MKAVGDMSRVELVSRCQQVDLAEIERWSNNEKCAAQFEAFRSQLV